MLANVLPASAPRHMEQLRIVFGSLLRTHDQRLLSITHLKSNLLAISEHGTPETAATASTKLIVSSDSGSKRTAAAFLAEIRTRFSTEVAALFSTPPLPDLVGGPK
ncbi:MAG: hypothetical protein OXD33_05445 [Rhodobacteraceae bacterium]|nr:hypothetical protein [Paracoccaceae bacterium]